MVTHRFLKGHINVVDVSRITRFIRVGLEPYPHRFNLDDAPPEGQQQRILVRLRLRHDVQDPNPQRTNVLPYGMFRRNTKHATFFERAPGVIMLRKDDGH